MSSPARIGTAPHSPAALVRCAGLLLLSISFGLAASTPPASAQERPRLIVLTDIGGDPDDMQSMRRLMLYSNDLQILGLIASASGTARDGRPPMTRPELIREIVDDYAQVRDNLRLHDVRYPHPDHLRALIRSGSAERGVANLGPGRDTEGSRYLVSTVDAAPGPVHVAIWGGAHDLAQALHDVRASRDTAETNRFLSRLRVYAISDQMLGTASAAPANGSAKTSRICATWRPDHRE